MALAFRAPTDPKSLVSWCVWDRRPMQLANFIKNVEESGCLGCEVGSSGIWWIE
jgi:hypothetical protein